MAWGVIYLKNLFEGINENKKIKIKPVIITDYRSTDDDVSFLKELKSLEVIFLVDLILIE